MSDFKNSLAYLIANQVPDYIRAEFPQFVLFLEKYYEFLDQDGEANNVLLNASSFSDINNTLDAFVPSFREQYLQMFPKDSLITDKRLIKFIREFYEAKGSEESILFIFRTFFNEHVDIIYPSKFVLKASDGVWINREKMRITTDDTISLDPFELKGKRAKIYSHINIGSVATFETHDIIVDEVTRLAYSTVPTYELYVKHEENDTVTLPGAGGNAVPLIVDGEIKAITGDPAVSSRDFDPAENFDIYARFLIPDHGFTTGDCVIYDPMEGSAIGGLIPYRQYFVKVIDSRYFRLYRDKIALQQVPTRTFFKSANVNISTNTITIAAHGYNTGDLVVYKADSTGIGGLDDTGVYYVIKINNNTIKLAESLIDSDPRYCLDDTYFAADYVTISTYSELNLTSVGVGNFHALSKEYFINFTSAGTGAEQRFIDAMDASGSGYNAIPAVTFISDIDATGATAQAYLNDTGGIEYVSMLTGGTGYTEESTIISFSTDTIRSFVYIDEFTDKYGYVSRSITDTVGIVSVSGSPNYGFLQGEVYSISESGTTGQYVFSFPDTSLNYFAGDYVQFGVDNRASVIIDSVNAQGRPTKVRIFSSGSGFEAQTFTATITSTSGSNCVLSFTTGAITSIQEGFQNRQGMLSDVNKLQDNYYYQNYSYVLRSKVPSVNWMTMVKNTVHPAGMAIFSELLLGSTLELGASFEVVRQPIHFYEFPVEIVRAVEILGVSYDIAVDFRKTLNDTYLAEEQHVSHVGKNVSFSYVTPFDNASALYGTTFEITGDGGLYTMTISIDNEGAITIISGAATPFGYYVSIGGTTFEHISGDDIVTSSDILNNFSVGKSVVDTPVTSDIIDTFDVGKTLLDIPLTTDDIYFGFLRNISESYIASDSSISDFYKYETDIILSTIDTASIQAGKGLTETVASGDSIPYMVITKLINETVTVTESIDSIDLTHTIPNDDPTVTDVLETSFTKTLTDGVSISDSNSLSVNKASSDGLPNGVNENIEIIEPGKAAQSTLHTMEDTYSSINKNLVETSTVSEIGNINTQDYWSYDYTSGAYEAGDYVGSNNSI
jgi:hypothetical protein